MKKLLNYIKAEEVIEVCYEGDNWVEIKDFVGKDNFHYSFGNLHIKTRNGNLAQVNQGDSIVKLSSGLFEVFTKAEIESFEVIETDYEEVVEDKVEIDDELN